MGVVLFTFSGIPLCKKGTRRLSKVKLVYDSFCFIGRLASVVFTVCFLDSGTGEVPEIVNKYFNFSTVVTFLNINALGVLTAVNRPRLTNYFLELRKASLKFDRIPGRAEATNILRSLVVVTCVILVALSGFAHVDLMVGLVTARNYQVLVYIIVILESITLVFIAWAMYFTLITFHIMEAELMESFGRRPDSQTLPNLDSVLPVIELGVYTVHTPKSLSCKSYRCQEDLKILSVVKQLSFTVNSCLSPPITIIIINSVVCMPISFIAQYYMCDKYSVYGVSSVTNVLWVLASLSPTFFNIWRHSRRENLWLKTTRKIFTSGYRQVQSVLSRLALSASDEFPWLLFDLDCNLLLTTTFVIPQKN
ncbi:hypothetical protein J6590_046782 [Homalodisca vitripennis]|nr:hypothetical protein J6590_046782 [Homalodisca vitripennis]